MDTLDLKKLDKLLNLCRKRGVSSIKIGEIELNLAITDFSTKKSNKKQLKTTETLQSQNNVIPTEEQLMFWSSDLANDALAV